jgi:energy-coupling factor transport system substrate-specific component
VTVAVAASPAIRLRPRAAVLLAGASMLGLAAFLWPLLASPSPGDVDLAHASDAPWLFVALLPLLLGIVVAEIADGGLDAKAVALLGVLAACGAALRMPSGGAAGFEPIFFLLIPAGRVFGRGFGFVLGAVTLFASALITGGVGPWLPFQMFGAAWVGFFAGCLPRCAGRRELGLMAAYGLVAGLVYGLLLNLWFWPFGTGTGGSLGFVPGGGFAENLRRFWAFHLATSLGFDIPRALTNAVLVLAAGRPVLLALRRAARRAAFGEAAVFADAAEPGEPAKLAGAPVIGR